MTLYPETVEGVIYSPGYPLKHPVGQCGVEIYFARQSNITVTVRDVDLQDGDTLRIRVLDACGRLTWNKTYPDVTDIYFREEIKTISVYGNVLMVNCDQETPNTALFLLSYTGII